MYVRILLQRAVHDWERHSLALIGGVPQNCEGMRLKINLVSLVILPLFLRQ